MRFSCLPALLLAATVASQRSLDPSDYDKKDILERDVAVIGGGATGTYGAIRLADEGLSVVLIEKKDALGGHTSAYSNQQDTIINYGLENFQNTTHVRDFFARFDLELVPYVSSAEETQFADFSSGTVHSVPAPPPDFNAYLAQLDRFPYLTWTWELPDPVPEDLLLPFGEFVAKHSLQDWANVLASHAAGNGDVMNQTAVYVLKSIDRAYLEGLEGSDVMSPTNNHEVYEKAREQLGSDALVSSTVEAASRPAADGESDSKNEDEDIKLAVRTPEGDRLVVAKKLLVAMPQNAENMEPLDLDTPESDVFTQFTNTALYVGLVTDTGVPDYTDTFGVDLDDEFNIPSLPGLVYLQSTNTAGVFRIWYSSQTAVPEDEVKSATLAAIKNLTGHDATFLVFGSHTPYQLAVSPDAIRDGFYGDLYALQGRRKTWYTGAAFLSHHTASLWNFTEALIPQVAAG